MPLQLKWPNVLKSNKSSIIITSTTFLAELQILELPQYSKIQTNLSNNNIASSNMYSSLQCSDTVGWATEGHLACKKLGVGLLVVMIWLELCTFLIAPVVTMTSITLSSNTVQNGDILVPANPGPPGKMAVKTERERQREREREVAAANRTQIAITPTSSSVSSKVFDKFHRSRSFMARTDSVFWIHFNDNKNNISL